MNEFAPYRLPKREGNMIGWLIEVDDEPLEHEASEKGVDSDLEFLRCYFVLLEWGVLVERMFVLAACSVDAGRDIYTRCYQQLQTILPQIVTQVTNNVNKANGGNGRNGGNNGCTYKGFMACNPKEYDGKGGAIPLTR
ncbi:hypothetical protein Tco_0199119 [Tanacetum coccineum]